MTIRDTTITKLQQLSEPLLQEVSDFISIRRTEVQFCVWQNHWSQPGHA
jgi:hypothetical protein